MTVRANQLPVLASTTHSKIHCWLILDVLVKVQLTPHIARPVHQSKVIWRMTVLGLRMVEYFPIHAASSIDLFDP